MERILQALQLERSSITFKINKEMQKPFSNWNHELLDSLESQFNILSKNIESLTK